TESETCSGDFGGDGRGGDDGE
ncbi:hypothetical protein A2U01_0079987, partial [Trifolium medium]|nr:hypothetical protein [Trifolium medium]